MSSINQTVAEWARITVERWEEKISQLGIGDSNALINSFTQQVITDSAGNPDLIRFTFEYYGKMVDMGVGRGVKATEIGNVETTRKPKPWYSKQFGREVYRLAEILAEAYGRRAVTIIIQNIEQK